MNKIKNAFNKAQNKVNELAIRAKTAIQNKSGEGYIDTAVKIIIGVDDGDLVIVRQQDTCRDGDYAVVLVDGRETLLKTVTYLPEKKAYLLHAENPNYDDRIERDVQIQGVATQVIKQL